MEKQELIKLCVLYGMAMFGVPENKDTQEVVAKYVNLNNYNKVNGSGFIFEDNPLIVERYIINDIRDLMEQCGGDIDIAYIEDMMDMTFWFGDKLDGNAMAGCDFQHIYHYGMLTKHKYVNCYAVEDNCIYRFGFPPTYDLFLAGLAKLGIKA